MKVILAANKNIHTGFVGENIE